MKIIDSFWNDTYGDILLPDNNAPTKYFGYIYLVYNIINGKKYIGKHKHSKKRKNKNLLSDDYLGSGTLIVKAINKYGAKSFIKYIFDYALTESELKSKEKYWIQSFNAQQRDDFYNIHEGGGGGDTLTYNPNLKEIRKNMSESAKGKHIGQEPWNKGKKNCFSDEHCKYLSTKLKGKEPWNKGLKLDEKYSKIFSEAQLKSYNGPNGNIIRKHHSLGQIKRYSGPNSEEERRKISIRSKGKTHKVSEESRKQLSESGKAYFASPEGEEQKKYLSSLYSGCKYIETNRKRYYYKIIDKTITWVRRIPPIDVINELEHKIKLRYKL